VTINVTAALPTGERLLIVFHDAADIVPVLPNDVRAISDLDGECLCGEDHSDHEGRYLLTAFSWEHPPAKPWNQKIAVNL
jgi:hypothetical protein